MLPDKPKVFALESFNIRPRFFGDGVYEMREHFGPGWRLYYTKRRDTLIVMLGGGDKGSQESDIAKAKQRETILED